MTVLVFAGLGRCWGIIGWIAALHGADLHGWVWIRGFVLSCSPSPLIPLPSRERGCMVGVVLLSARPLHLWIADQARNELAPRSYPVVTQRGVSGRCSAWRCPAA